ncbi:MAG: beta-ketoacyl synthase chain length factor [Myxococcales bacterium]|nr:beta-ketoacyl synthase chain length factor [Myxococcales bacterium]MCB9754357.1 beta-ketoacyl synthase chain length factor [Myxococcales bacterium]
MSALRFSITSVAVWAPGFAEVDALVRRTPDPSVSKPSALLLPARLRRRTSLLTRMIAEVCERAMAAAELPRGAAGVVCASAYGEIQTTGALLTALTADAREPLSPVRFHNSVHNTATGYLSIATENRGFNTALAAGRDSPAMAVLEGATALRAGVCERVVVAIGEEPLPEPLAEVGGRYAPLAVGLALAPAGVGPDFVMSKETCSNNHVDTLPPLPAELSGNPCAAALRIVELWAGAAASVPLGGGYALARAEEGPR